MLFYAFGFLVAIPSQPDQAFLGALHVPPKHESSSVTLLFVGDVMLDRGVEFEIQKNGGDWTWPFRHIASFLHQADLVFGNLESQISDKGVNVGSIYSFRANPKSIEALSYAGFDVVSVANNHSFDYTREAFEDSLTRLANADIAYTGGGFSEAEAHTPVIIEIEGTRIGLLAYTNSGLAAWQARSTGSGQATESTAGITWVDWDTLDELQQDIQKAKAKVDILAVSIHAGEEYAKEPSDFQRLFAKTAIDEGADLIIGHHPHVLQPLEQYKEGWIIYSLGNFLFDQDFSQETMRAAILKVVVENKEITNVSLLSTKINSSFQVELVK